MTQSELQTLYTGNEIKSSEVYAQVFTSLWVIMMYSSGMPIMYALGFLTFAVSYLVQKCTIIKYHRKTTAFDQ